MKAFTFSDITVTIEAKDGKAAYTALCNMLSKAEAFSTSTVTDESTGLCCSTERFFPEVR